MKKLCVMLLSVMMLFSVCMPCLAAENTRLPLSEIPVMTDRQASGFVRLGILKGTEKGYELERNVTRAEALTFIERTVKPMLIKATYELAPFSDVSGHWAQDTILGFYAQGFVEGTDVGTYEPNRTVTGKEFVKILLSAMGYEGVTLETAYDLGKTTQVLNNNHTKSPVYNNDNLRRSDVLNILQGALTGKMPQGEMLYRTLIDRGFYTQDDFYGFLYAGTPAAYTSDFNYKVNQMMPKDKNYMFSPLSIKFAFAMAANGAEGETKEQLLKALEIEDLNAFNEYTKTLMAQYNSAEVLNLNVANSIWLNEERYPTRFTEHFQGITRDFYNAEADVVNYQTAVPNVNEWVNKQTNGKIPTVISDGEFVVLLVNALYFKGAWQQEFPKRFTQKETFTSRDGSKTEIDFMRQTNYFQYDENNGAEIIVLPYKNRQYKEDENGSFLGVEESDADISMYLIKGEYTNHTEILKELARSDKRKQKTYVTLKVPKFELEYQTGLNDVMITLGATSAFTPGLAQFSPMVEEGDLYIRESLQKTYIKIDEEGTEAAAVTVIAADKAAAVQPPEPIEVTFDEPFTFVIYDNKNNEVLFLGEYAYAQ